MKEIIRCNICDINIDIGMTKEHSSVSDHIYRRSNLEKSLETIRISEIYKDDNSVISKWQKCDNN
jgi:hypothetical protein